MKIRMGVNELGNTLLYGFHIFSTTGGTTRITRWKVSTAYIKSVPNMLYKIRRQKASTKELKRILLLLKS